MKEYDCFVFYIYFKNINWSVGLVIILNYKTATQVCGPMAYLAYLNNQLV